MKTLILCNGRPPTPDLFSEVYRWADYFIAADGGGNIARAFESPPDIVTGDMDSFVQRQEDSFEVAYDPDQETNDLEKALKVARRANAGEVIILGATGRRVDQTLKNISVLKQFNSHFSRLVIRDEYNDLFLIPKTFSIELPVGTMVSLFPLSGVVTGIRTQGLKYALHHESLENGVRDGSSNEVTASPASITYDEGDLVFIIVRQ